MRLFGQQTNGRVRVEVVYSNALENIDGFLVTDGASARITLRSSLNAYDRERGKEALLQYLDYNPGKGVYTWRVDE